MSQALRPSVNRFQLELAVEKTQTSMERFAPIGRRKVSRLGRAAPLMSGAAFSSVPSKVAQICQAKRQVSELAALVTNQTLRSVTRSFQGAAQPKLAAQRALVPREVFVPTGRRRAFRLERAVLLVLGALFSTRRFGEVWVPLRSQETSEKGQTVLGTFAT